MLSLLFALFFFFLLKCIYYPLVRWIQTKEKHCVCQLECWRIWECWRHRVAGGESSTMKLIICLYCLNLCWFQHPSLILLMYLFVYPGLSYFSEHEGLLLHQPGWSCWRYLLHVSCKTLNQSPKYFTILLSVPTRPVTTLCWAKYCPINDHMK